MLKNKILMVLAAIGFIVIVILIFPSKICAQLNTDNIADSIETKILLENIQKDDTVKYEKNLDVDTSANEALSTVNFYDELTSEFNPRERLTNQTSKLSIFGQHFFNISTELLNEPNINPVNSEYKLGVGDEIIIQIWGDVQIVESLSIAENGTVTPVGLGQVKVAGLTLVEAKKMFIQKFSRIYSGVLNGAKHATTFVDVTTGTIKQKSIIVVGEVKTPGNYLISPTAGVVSAIAKAGGPENTASLRTVYIRRGGGNKLDSIDLYDFFLTGRITDTTTLADFDVIMVNPVNKRVAIEGAVRRPAQYELKDDETFEDLFRFCGGLLSEAFTKNIVIERTEQGTARKSFTINREDFANMYPSDNDFILIDFIDKINNTVSIEGAVERPGNWEFKEGMKVSDLIELAGGVLDNYFGDRIEIFRTNTDLSKKVLSLNVKELLNKTGSDLELQKWDVVKIYSIWDLQYKKYVDIYGEVKMPGKYFLREGMTIQDIILLAGGFNNIANKDTIEISRVVYSGAKTGNKAKAERVTVLEDFFKNSTHHLRHRDIILVRQDMSIKPQEIVILSGEFVSPGYYTKLSPDETLSDLVERAGGFTNSAYLDGARLNRSKDSIGNIGIDFELLFNKNRIREDIILENGDSVFVPTKPKTIEVIGAVYNPMNVKFVENVSVGNYIKRAGGSTILGKRGTIYVTRANGEVIKVRKFNKRVLNSGSQIVVNEGKPRKDRNSSNFIDAITAFSSMAMSVIAVILLSKEL